MGSLWVGHRPERARLGMGVGAIGAFGSISGNDPSLALWLVAAVFDNLLKPPSLNCIALPASCGARRGSGPVKPQSDVDDALASEVLRKVQRPASWPAQIQNSDFNGRFDKVARTGTARAPLLASGAEAFPATLRHRQPCGRTWARAQALPPSFSPCLSSSILPSRDPAKARQRSDADFATARGERRGKGPVQPQSGAVDALQPRLRAAS